MNKCFIMSRHYSAIDLVLRPFQNIIKDSDNKKLYALLDLGLLSCRAMCRASSEDNSAKSRRRGSTNKTSPLDYFEKSP